MTRGHELAMVALCSQLQRVANFSESSSEVVMSGAGGLLAW